MRGRGIGLEGLAKGTSSTFKEERSSCDSLETLRGDLSNSKFGKDGELVGHSPRDGQQNVANCLFLSGWGRWLEAEDPVHM